MKGIKFLCLATVAALLLAPTCAMAKTNISFSINLFDFVPMLAPRPVIIAPPPRPVFVPCYPVPYQQRTIVKEIHHYHQYPEYEEENDQPTYYYRGYPRCR